MKLFKRDKQEKTENKERPEKVKVVNIGRRKTSLIVLWSLFAVAFLWSVYKNFTGIDTHTIHETQVIETKVSDTSGIESFVRKFAGSYYTWSDNSESLDGRQEALENYMTSDLVKLNQNVITADDGASSSVSDFKIWELVQLGDNDYMVVYTVQQKVKRTEVETVTEYVEEPEMQEVVNEETGEVSYQESIVQKQVESQVESPVEVQTEASYMVIVHVDDNGNMVITHNPTISSISGKSDYVPATVSSDGSVDTDTSNEIAEFLTAFFKLYPAADSSELAYYVKNDALSPINKDYEFVEITDGVYKEVDGQIMAYVTVKYYDKKTGVNQLSRFTLGLEESENETA